MRFIDAYNKDLFEEWLKKKMEEYEKVDQFSYSLVIKDVLQAYRSHKENERDCSGK